MHRRGLEWTAGFALAALALTGAAAEEPLARAEHCVVLVIDGLRPDLITADGMPRLHAALGHSAFTLHATTVSPSRTLPAHVSLLTGLAPQQHGVLWNTVREPRLPLAVPTVFDAVHEAGGRTAFLAGKRKLSQAVSPGSVDLLHASRRDGTAVLEEAFAVLREQRPALTLIHLPDADRAGHRWGWGGERQRRALRDLDRGIGALLDLLAEERRSARFALIVTADHGGLGHDHGGDDPRVRTIPWIVWGDGVRPGEIAPRSLEATAGAVLAILGLDAGPAQGRSTK